MTHDETIRVFDQLFKLLDAAGKLLLECRAKHEAEAARRAAAKCLPQCFIRHAHAPGCPNGPSDDKSADDYLKQLRKQYEKPYQPQPLPMWPKYPNTHPVPYLQEPYRPAPMVPGAIYCGAIG